VRAELGLAAMTASLWAAGALVLRAAGIVHGARSLAVWSGLAFLVGTATVGVALVALAVAGAGPTSVSVAATFVGVAAVAGVAASRLRVPPPAPAAHRARRQTPVLVAVGVAAAVVLVCGTRLAAVHPVEAFDAWALWVVKARLIYDAGRIPDELSTGGYELMHVDYPMLLPVLDAAYFRVMGGMDPKLGALPYWTLHVAFAWTFAAVGARLTCAALWAPLVAVFAMTPVVLAQVFSHLADVPTATLAGSGALLAGLWLHTRERRWLVLATLLLAGAANGKHEGLAAAFAVLASLLLASAVGRRARRDMRAVAAAAGAVVLAILPWRLWIATHDVRGGDIDAADALDPGLLADRADRVGPALDGIVDQLTDVDRWGTLAAATVALTALALSRAATRPIAAYYGASIVLVGGSLTVAYWISNWEIHDHVAASADRVVQTAGFLGFAAVLHLAAQLYEGDEDEERRARLPTAAGQPASAPVGFTPPG
jgi:hypothetical protein